MPIFPYAESVALVTGASRGIGAALARALAKRGVQALILTARAEADLDALADELCTVYGVRVETIIADLSRSDAPATLQAEITRRGMGVDLLINNAGWGTHGTFAGTDAGKSRDMVEVNVQALVELSHRFLPGMISRNRGAVVNIASTAAFQPVPFMAVYGATKAFVLSLSEALAVEVREQGADNVRVVALCPGGTATNFGDGMLRGQFENAKQDTPEQVADATLAALDANTPVAVVGTQNALMVWSERFAPRRTVAEIAGRLFRPADLPKRKPAAPVTLWQLLLAATGVLGVVLAALFLSRRDRR